MSPADFDRLTEEAIATVPVRYRKRLKNIVFVVEPEPPCRGLLGLYEMHPPFPEKITVFQGPHERMTRSLPELFSLVQETILHEIGHALGMNESEVLRMERARRSRIRRRASLK